MNFLLPIVGMAGLAVVATVVGGVAVATNVTAGGVRAVRRHRMARRARSLYVRYRDLYSGPRDLAPAEVARFLDLDPPWLDARAAEAAGAGFSHLGDYTTPRTAKRFRSQRNVMRMMLSPDRSAVLCFRVFGYRGPLFRLMLALSRRPRIVRSWQLVSRFSDMTSVTVGNDPLLLVATPLPGSVVRCLPYTDPWTVGPELQRATVEAHMAADLERVIWLMNDSSDFMAAENEFWDHGAEWRRARGFVTPDMVRAMGRGMVNAAAYEEIAVELAALIAAERAAGNLPPAPEEELAPAPEGSAP